MAKKSIIIDEIEEKKILTLLVLKHDNHEIEFQISNQSHIGKDFGINKNSFIASNGFVLKSDCYPEIGGEYTLQVRGDEDIRDYTTIYCDIPYFERLAFAVKEYNGVSSYGDCIERSF